MGMFCAQSMAIENILPNIWSELFTHVTTFYGYKVIKKLKLKVKKFFLGCFIRRFFSNKTGKTL